MPLTAGARLGPYEIVSALGAVNTKLADTAPPSIAVIFNWTALLKK